MELMNQLLTNQKITTQKINVNLEKNIYILVAEKYRKSISERLMQQKISAKIRQFLASFMIL